jgi:hypothetical protein
MKDGFYRQKSRQEKIIASNSAVHLPLRRNYDIRNATNLFETSIIVQNGEVFEEQSV